MRIIMVGRGELVYYLTRQFSSKNFRVTVVVADAREAEELARRLEVTVLAGDGTDMQVMENAGARRAEVVLALTGNDEDNLAICQIAGKMFHVPRTIALVHDPDNEEVFHQLKVSVAVSATRIISTLLQEQAGFEQITEMISLVEGKISVSEVNLREDAPAVESQLQDLDLPQGVLIGGIIRRDEVIVPRGNTLLQGGDRLILIAAEETFEAAMDLLVGGRE